MPAPVRFQVGDLVWAESAKAFGTIDEVHDRYDPPFYYVVLFKVGKLPFGEPICRAILTFAGPVALSK